MHPINIFANKNRLKLKSYDKKILIADRTLPEANFGNPPKSKPPESKSV